jgi:PAS domain S-box-containing protein
MHIPVVAEAAAPITTQSRRMSLPSLSSLLFRLVFACLVPALLGVGFMIYLDYERGRTELKENTRLRLEDKLEAVDAQIAEAELFAQTLAINASLIRQDFATFHQDLLRLLRANNLNFTVLVYDASGQQVINTDIPYGERLLRRQDIANIQSVFASGQMMRSHIALGTLDGQPTVDVLAPVFASKKVMYALSVGFSPKSLNRLTEQQPPLANSIAVVLDSTNTIATMSPNAKNFFDKQVDPELLKQLKEKTEGAVEFTSFSGAQILSTYRRSPRSGWTVVIATPKNSIKAPLMWNLFTLALGGVLLLGLSLGSAWIVGKRIAKSIHELHDAAVALSAGDLKDMPATATIEIHELGQALHASARILKRRTQQLQTANENLLESSSELSESQYIAKLGSWKWDAGTTVVLASKGLQRLLGQKILLPFAEQRGIIFPEAAWNELKTSAKSTLQTKTGFSLLLPVLRSIGTPIWTRVNGEVVCNSTGDVTGLRGTLQDVDAVIKADIALKNSESRLSLALSNSDMALWDWNITTDEVYFDIRSASIHGFTVEEVPPNRVAFMRLVHPEDVAQILEKIEQLFKANSTNFEVTYRDKHKYGHYIWIHAKGKVVERDIDQKPLRLIGVAYDITERKHQESVKEVLHDELAAMLVWQVAQHTVAALAHEVNQPLTSASILCEAASRMLKVNSASSDARVEAPERLSMTLKNIASDIERAGSVLRNLLTSVSKPNITREPVSVDAFIRETIQTAIEQGIFGYQIRTHFAPLLPLVRINHPQVSKVLLNLIHNGAQAMHDAKSDGQLSIYAVLSADGCEVCVSVRDAGPGVSTKLQQEIFQPFITTKSHGLGMGLTISRALIEANGGKLWHSQDDGLGATFHFTLPISS